MTTPIRPSSVTDWNRCPRYWWYKEQGWQAPPSAWTPEKLVGTAIHAGLSAHWDGFLSLILAVQDVFSSQWPQDAPPEFSREDLESQALKVLDAVLTWIAKEMPDAEPVMVEQTLRDDGCTPDLVTREPVGLVVTDWKTSLNLPADRIPYRLQDIDRTWQFLDYAWQVGQTLGEPVAMVRKVVIAAGPKILVREGTFIPTPEMLAAWHRDAVVKWGLMNEMRLGTVYPWRNEDGCLKYGEKWRCPYYEGCWTCHGNEEKMGQFLVKGTR